MGKSRNGALARGRQRYRKTKLVHNAAVVGSRCACYISLLQLRLQHFYVCRLSYSWLCLCAPVPAELPQRQQQ